MKPLDYDARLDAMLRGKPLPKALRDQLQWARLSHEPSAKDVANALFSLRGMAKKHGEIEALATELTRALRYAGHDPGVTPADADSLVVRLVTGCWIVDAPAPDGALVVLGGLEWEKIHEELAAKSAAEPKRGLFATMNTPTHWSVYVGTLEEPVRERIDRVKRACENAGVLRDPPCGSWNHDHHFAFTDGSTLCFSWRAWGDLLVAITSEGDYMDHYA